MVAHALLGRALSVGGTSPTPQSAPQVHGPTASPGSALHPEGHPAGGQGLRGALGSHTLVMRSGVRKSLGTADKPLCLLQQCPCKLGIFLA